MKRHTLRRKVLEEQGGFTLVEVLVTMLMMLTVMFALYSIFDMSLRVFSFGNDKVEAVENARLGMERMEREIRAAYPVDKGNDEDHLFFVSGNPTNESFPGDQTITFGNDLDGNREIECPDPDSDPDTECETITYQTYTPSGSTTDALGRANSYGGNNQAVVEFVDDLTFEYLDGDGDLCDSSNTDCTGTDESQIQMVSITLVVDVDGREQTLNTDVALRNRSE